MVEQMFNKEKKKEFYFRENVLYNMKMKQKILEKKRTNIGKITNTVQKHAKGFLKMF